MKRLALLLVAVLMGGCGTASSVRVDIPIVDNHTFAFFDERPAEERIARKEITRYATTTYFGDDNLSPAAAELFKAYLAKQMGEPLSGKTVALKRFFVSVSDPEVSLDKAGFRGAVNSVPNANPIAVILAAPIIFGIESAKSKKIVMVEIVAAIGSQEYENRCSEQFRGRVTEDNVRSVVLSCLERTVNEMNPNKATEKPAGETDAKQPSEPETKS